VLATFSSWQWTVMVAYLRLSQRKNAGTPMAAAAQRLRAAAQRLRAAAAETIKTLKRANGVRFVFCVCGGYMLLAITLPVQLDLLPGWEGGVKASTLIILIYIIHIILISFIL